MPHEIQKPLTGGGRLKLPPLIDREDEELFKLVTLTRSLELWRKRIDHGKCSLVKGEVAANLCHFCLTRSLMVKLNRSQTRTGIKPIEISRFLAGGRDVKILISDLIGAVSEACPDVSGQFGTSLSCTDCSEKLFGGDNCVIDLNSSVKNEDLSILINQREVDLLSSHRKHCTGELPQLSLSSTVLFLSCGAGANLRLSERFKLFGKTFRCKAVITETSYYFSYQNSWYQVSNGNIIEFQEYSVSDALLVSLESPTEEDPFSDEEEIIYQKEEYRSISNCSNRHKDKRDRHLDKSDRHLDKSDRHLDKSDRHLDTPQRREDRHLDTPQRNEDRHLDKSDRHLDKTDRHLDKTDRHLDTPQRRVDRHKDKSFSRTLQKVKKEINEDTGMDVICCSCLELKSRRSCVSMKSLSEELITKYCHQDEVSRSLDGEFYVCITCNISIRADKEPVRAMKELFGLLEFPEGEF